jgi:hypothetical protein
MAAMIRRSPSARRAWCSDSMFVDSAQRAITATTPSDRPSSPASTTRSSSAGASSRWGVSGASSTRLREMVEALVTAACCWRSSRKAYTLPSTSASRDRRASSCWAGRDRFHLVLEPGDHLVQRFHLLLRPGRPADDVVLHHLQLILHQRPLLDGRRGLGGEPLLHLAQLLPGLGQVAAQAGQHRSSFSPIMKPSMGTSRVASVSRTRSKAGGLQPGGHPLLLVPAQLVAECLRLLTQRHHR